MRRSSIKRHARRLAKELSDTRKLQIKTVIVQHFRDSVEYLDKLTKYSTTAYMEFINDMIKLMTERGIEAVIPILAEARASFRAPVSSTQIV